MQPKHSYSEIWAYHDPVTITPGLKENYLKTTFQELQARRICFNNNTLCL